MRAMVPVIVFFLFQVFGHSQETTIKFKKESNLSKAVFDNTELKLMAVDRFGNPRENKIVSFKLYVSTKRGAKEFPGHSNHLTDDMTSYLNKQKRAVKIFFTEIIVTDDSGHFLKLPDVIEMWFPVCQNLEKDKRRK